MDYFVMYYIFRVIYQWICFLPEEEQEFARKRESGQWSLRGAAAAQLAPPE